MLWSNSAQIGLVLVAIAGTASAAEQQVAVHASENTTARWSYTSWKNYHPNQYLEEALKSDGTPFIEVTDADIANGRLLNNGVPRYPILFSLAAEAISDAEVTNLRAYVNAGGTAYVSASAWTRRETGALRLDATGQPMFALGPEMGLKPGGWTKTTNVLKVANNAMVSHLPMGTSLLWDMPQDYLSVPLYGEPHWIWQTFATAAAPASIVLTEGQDPLFQPSFANPPEIPAPASSPAVFADVDGDARADLVFRSGSNVFVRLSNGQQFLPATLWSTWNPNYDFYVADVNGDGKADLIGRSSTVADVQVGLSTGQSFAASTQWTTWSLAFSIQFADVDGDGAADIIGRLLSGNSVWVGLSNGKTGGLSFAPATQWTTFNPSYSMQFADVDGDGDADIVGRLNGGSDVQVSLSNGKAGTHTFANSTGWATWNPSYTLFLGDVNGDKKADIAGRSSAGDVQVGLSTGQTFQGSSRWTTWNLDFTTNLADMNGDGKQDLLGIKTVDLNSPTFPLGDIEAALSGGASASTAVKLATKAFGAGVFIYNSEIVPVAGHGGFANDNSEYKTIRISIVNAFSRLNTPLVNLAAWPFPNRAGLIFRHDHYFATDIHQSELSWTNASPAQPFGETYVLPDVANYSGPCIVTNSSIGPCQEANNYPTDAAWAVSTGALIGAHALGHASLDALSYAQALQNLNDTKTAIQCMSGAIPTYFVAPVYFAIKQSSLQAVWDAGFLATGEQGVGPFPHFAMNPEVKGGYVGALLEVPTSEWPGDLASFVQQGRLGFDNMERMSIVSPGSITTATDLSYEVGGLINVYDHSGGDPRDYTALVCPPAGPTRRDLAELYLSHATSLAGVWPTNSAVIRNWWLQRDTRVLSSTFTIVSSTATVVNVTLQTRPPRAATTYPTTNIAVRLSLDNASLTKSQTGVRVTLDGVLQSGTTCQNNARVRCNGSEVYVQVGGASQASIRLGTP